MSTSFVSLSLERHHHVLIIPSPQGPPDPFNILLVPVGSNAAASASGAIPEAVPLNIYRVRHL